jgi:hypothetical protein
VASVLHGSARTTPRVRAELKAAQAPARVLATQYGLNVKTVLKWRNRVEIIDAPMGPKPKSTVLTPVEEAVIVEFRRRTLLPLDDVLGCLRDTIPNLSRSALHRCLQRHGISRLPAGETTEKRKRFKTYDIGYVHIDSADRTNEPNRQGSNRQNLPLREPGKHQGTCAQLRHRRQLRQTPKGTEVENTLPKHLRCLEIKPVSV